MQAAAGSSFAQPPAPDAPDADLEERAFQEAVFNLSHEDFKKCAMKAVALVLLQGASKNLDVSTPAGRERALSKAKRRISDINASIACTREPRIAKQAARKQAARKPAGRSKSV